ncbi:MAG: hypothetical protein AAFX03_04370 [Pseudomonadota bacterium]
MKLRDLAAAASVTAIVAGCAAPGGEPIDIHAFETVEMMTGYKVSEAAMATAVIGDNGKPVGALAYETPADAVKAGDMAAFVHLVKLDQMTGDAPPAFTAMILSIDRAADGDVEAARALLEDARGRNPNSDLPDYLDSWMLALEGDGDAAVDIHRQSAAALPGLTADLSLAAMLEGLGRDEEALAVYAALTPGEITAPEHDFDPQGIIFGHVQTVIARRTLLLRRLDRIEEAQAVYTRLAEAEPEQAARYAAAMESLIDGEGLDDEALTARTAFARTIADVSLSLYQQRLIRASVVGQRARGFDHERSSLDQMALLLAPENTGLRELVVNGLYREALFDGAAHVALSAPEPDAGLQLSAAQALLRAGEPDKAREALKRAADYAEDDERLNIASGSASIYMLLGDEDKAISLAEEGVGLAENDAERAFAHAVKAQVLQQFARHEDALVHARAARDLDDTHDRRVFLASVMGKAGEVDEATKILRAERLARPNDPYALNSLGYFLITETDRIEEGYKILVRAHALANNDPYIADSVGWAKFKFGEFDGARVLVEQSRDELSPHTHWEIDDHLGDIYWALDREVEAQEYWERALTTFPPKDVRVLIEDKLENGLQSLPESRPLPDVSLQDGAVERQDI